MACGKPAVRIMLHPGRESERAGYAMCKECATKAHEAGGRSVKQGESYFPMVDSLAGQPPSTKRNDEDELDDVEAAPEVSDPGKIERVGSLAKEQVRLLEQIEAKEAELKKLNEALRANVEAHLPEAMSQAEMTYFELTNGGSVEVKKIVRAGIPSKDSKKPEAAAIRKKALAWLMKHAPDIVKHSIVIQFGMEDDAFFKKFLRDLAKRKKPVKATVDDSVHAGTLGRYVREMDEANKTVPEELLGVHRVTIAEVKLAKVSSEA